LTCSRARRGQRSLDLLPREFKLLDCMMRRTGQTITRAMLWHRRLDDVPAHRRLRGVVLRVARTL
jgi:DNA-binding response OmpR family regulator